MIKCKIPANPNTPDITPPAIVNPKDIPHVAGAAAVPIANDNALPTILTINCTQPINQQKCSGSFSYASITFVQQS